jgi:drug/metabolite transporter (DMT)-like permease
MSISPESRHQEHFGKGVLFMLLGSVLFAVADALGKFTTQNFPLFEVVWLRSLFGAMLVALVIAGNGRWQDFRTTNYRAHAKRSIAGLFLSLFMLTGLKYIPLAEVTAIAFATPMIVAVYSAIVLKEKVGKDIFAAILIGLGGVILVVRPTPDHFHFGHLAMLGFALSSAYLSISARALVKTESALTLNLSIYPAGVVFFAGFAIKDWVTPDPVSLAALFGVALFATLALLSITRAVHLATPAKVTPFDYSRIIWSVSFGFLFWGELPDAVTWTGIAIIICCGLYIMNRGRRGRADSGQQ